MELLQIKKTEINASLRKEYRFFQISDMHLSYCDENSSDLDKWEHEQTGDKLKDMDMDCMVWKVPYELLDVFDDKSKEWTIEEINEVCDEFTKSESEEDNC